MKESDYEVPMVNESYKMGEFTANLIESLANSVGMGPAWKRVLNKNSKNYVNKAQVESMINQIVSKAQSLGQQKIDEIQQKLLTLGNGSSTFSDLFLQEAQKLQNELKIQQNKQAELGAKNADINYYLNQANMANAGDISSGRMKENYDSALKIAQNIEKEM